MNKPAQPKSTEPIRETPRKPRGIDLDGHFIVVDQIAGMTKVMMTPFNPDQVQPIDVFFDLLTKGQATLRITRRVEVGTPDEMGTAVDKLMAELEVLRDQLVEAVEA